MLTIFLLMLLTSYITGFILVLGVGIYFIRTDQDDEVTLKEVLFLSLASWLAFGVLFGALADDINELNN